MGKTVKYILKCVTCSAEYYSGSTFTCPDCGTFHGTLDVVYPLQRLKKKFCSLQKIDPSTSVYESFAEIFPYKIQKSLPPLKVGGTPLFKSKNISGITGYNNLFFKDDGRNPSASLKDRASAVAIAMAKESGAKIIAAASTGNAASSLATLSSSVGMKTVVFVPKNAPAPKMVQILMHSANVLRLDCDYDRAFDLCQKACNKFGWYNRNTAVNPYTGEGKKSAALEIAVELKKSPDAMIIPVGDGCILSGLYKGFSDLLGLGLIHKMPRLYGVQASGASPLVTAFKSGKPIIPLSSVSTVADSIAVGYPRDGIKALRAVRSSDGAMIAVNDEEIMSAQRLLASKGGIFSEPAASASMAGFFSLSDRGLVKKSETVVILLTGHGLKDIASASKNIEVEIPVTSPELTSIERAIEKLMI